MACHWYLCANDWLLTCYFQLIMGLNDLFTQGVQQISTVDFSKSNTADSVSIFESTIRYVGGLLSAYEMNNRADPVLLAKAKQLVDKLTLGWVGVSSVKFSSVFLLSWPSQRTTIYLLDTLTLVQVPQSATLSVTFAPPEVLPYYSWTSIFAVQYRRSRIGGLCF